MSTDRGQACTGRLVLEGRLAQPERIVLGLGGDRRRGRIVIWTSAIAARGAFVVVRVIQTLLGWLGRERQGRDIRRGGCAGHDVGR